MTTPSAKQNQFWIYIGTDTHPPSQSRGIYLYRLDASSGSFEDKGLVAELNDPGWQTFSRDGKHMYSVATDQNHERSIAVAFSVDRRSGALSKINQQATLGRDSTHIDIDPMQSCAVTANYSSSDVSILAINADGSLAPATIIKHQGNGPNKKRQMQPHPHATNFDPTGKFVLVPDLGNDKVYVYPFDSVRRSLGPACMTAEVASGAGPRHISFHPNRRFAYLVTEMGGTVVVYDWDAKAGSLREMETVSTLPVGFAAQNDSAEVRILPNGKFLYASNRGPDNIAIFSIDPAHGTLKNIGFVSTGGKGPRDFNIDPTGTFLLAENQYSDTINVFRINPDTGELCQATTLNVPVPFCATFLSVLE